MSNVINGKRVLITGGLGFIGSNLALRLVNEYASNITIFTKSNRKIKNIADIQEQVNIIQGDITNYDLVLSSVKDKDIIFHLAAQTSNIRSMESPILDLDVNLKGTLSVLEACRQVNPDAYIVSVGTVTQIGLPQSRPVSENEMCFPHTIYDAHKMLCEHYFRIYYQKFGLKTVFLRLPTIYGERQETNNIRTGIVNLFIAKALREETIQIFGDGKYLRDYIYVGDVVDALLLSIQNSKAIGNSFQVVSGNSVRFIDMVKIILYVVNKYNKSQAKYEHVSWPMEWKNIDVGDFIGNNEKIQTYLNWAPHTKFRDGIEKTVSFYMEHPEYLE